MTVEPPSLPDDGEPRDRRPAWWSWPVILLSLLFFVSVPIVFDQQKEKPGESANGEKDAETALPSPDWSHLAIFKLQSQLIIAASSVEPNQSDELRKELQANASDVYTLAALAIVTQFADTSEEGTAAALEVIRDSKFESKEKQYLEDVKVALKEGVTPDQRKEFGRSLDWFAELLPSKGEKGKLPAPDSEKIRSKAFVVAACMGIFVMGAVLAILIGMVLLVLFLVAVNSERSVLRFDRNTLPQGIMLECFAVYLGTMAVGEVLSIFVSHWISLATLVVAVVLAILWPKVRGVSGRDFRLSIGWTRGRGLITEVGAGMIGYLGMLPIALVGVGITFLIVWLSSGGAGLEQVHPGDPTSGAKANAPVTHPIIGWIMMGNIWVKLLCLFLASAFAPLTEETFFRGILHRYFRSKWAFLPAALAGAFIFAALHPQGWMAIPALTGMGVGFALIREWRNSLIASMTAHAINNGIIVGLVSLAL